MQIPPEIESNAAQVYRRKTDENHLRLLSIFYFIFAALTICGIGFLVLHYVMMNTIFTNPEMWKDQKTPMSDPRELMFIFKIIYFIVGFLFVLGGLANLLAGLFIRQRKHRVFTLVIAGMNCLQIPFGVALGIFTFVVLLRDSVKEIYGEAAAAPPNAR